MSEPTPSAAPPAVDAHDDGGWRTNTTTDAVAGWIGELSSVVVLTHVRPDGDAIGSSVALARSINLARGGAGAGVSGVLAAAETWYAGRVPPWAGRFLDGTKHRTIEEHEAPPGSVEPDGILIVDTGAWSQLRPFEAWLRPRSDRAVVLDHHLAGDPETSRARIVETRAAAACEVVAPLACRLLGVARPSALPREVAEPLFLGLATDTGWFRHANAGPAAHRLAADLLETGVDAGVLFEAVEHQDRPSRLRLLHRALGSMALHDGDSIAILRVTKEDLAAAGAGPGETGGFHDVIRSVASVRVSVVLTQADTAEGARTKVSLRSKGGDRFVDVNRVAKRFGGGGHAQASGASIDTDIDETARALLEAIRGEISLGQAHA